MRVGGLAVPESFAPRCPWCGLERPDHEACPRCGNELSCGGFGDVDTSFAHGASCFEVACDLRYLPAGTVWARVVRAYVKRGEELSGYKRAYEARVR